MVNVIRAWKDPVYRRAAGERSGSLEHPAGEVALGVLSEGELAVVNGAGTSKLATFGCCHSAEGTWTFVGLFIPPALPGIVIATQKLCN
ncbi:mersacidin/lichenicidin family type 2 lantibiotic [Amycolatopsis sp. NPDC049868]|uniref:mersacidin/lichenicidin family type 2 lantibiotic n=1 Tax=Amycolatopsis sp. NPDC049868 TaxID=3363934 RepID=UPI0037A4F5B8